MVFGYMPPGGRRESTPPPSSSGPSKGDLTNLQERFEKLKLVNMALWTFVKEKLGVTEEELIQRYKEIDMIDGNRDGKLTVGVRKCTKCGKVMNPKFDKCQYCGTFVQYGSIFEAV